MAKFSGVILILFGITMLGGGVYLASLGGSIYYGIAGAACVLSGILYWRGLRAGERLYALMLAGTLVWAWIESGDNPWALNARLFAFIVFGLWAAMPWVRRGLRDVADPAPWRSEAAIVAVIAFAVLAVRFMQFENAAKVDAPPSPVASDQTPVPADTDWANYGNGLDGKRFAPLTQINTQNVDKLKVAWTHRSGDFGPKNILEDTPLKVGDTVYICTAHNIVIALDPKTGQEKWRNDAKRDNSKIMVKTCRGLGFYHVPEGTGACTDRVIVAGPGPILRAIDAPTGQNCADFGKEGIVDLLTDLGRVDPAEYSPNSAPTVVGGMIMLGAYIADSYNADIASGVIRAYDAKTGELKWAWDMGAPDRIGPPPPGETYTRSTPNSWASFAADEALGLVYVPTGNPSPDYYGIHRRSFDEKYGSSIVALNIADGRVRWSYQTTHHDLFDYDLPAQPVLIDLPGPDAQRPAILVPTKRGDLFVLDRRDGSLIVPAPEIEVPGGAMPGENLSKTQPISQISFMPPRLTEAQMWGATPIDQMLCRIDFKRARYDGPFTPPSLQYTIEYPGTQGGYDWGSISVDDDNKLVVANTSDLPGYHQLVPREKMPDADNSLWPQKNTPYALEFGMVLGPLKIPCMQPPWGKLATIDLKTGQVVWRKVVGTARDAGPLNIKTHLPLLVGPPPLGGTLTTRGGLIFVAATMDRTFRAFDTKTGRLLWEYVLPAGGHATPMTYMAGGKQYVLLVAGGHPFYNSTLGDYTLAFALP